MVTADESGSDALPDPKRMNVAWSVIRVIIRLWSSICLRYRVRGLENLPADGGALLLANHQSFADPILVAVRFPRPVSYLARRNLFEVPVIGWILRSTYVMPIDRVGVTPSSIKEAVRRLKHGFLVGIFPEGTRTDDGTVGEFRTGFATLVRRGGVPVIPVGIAGAFECFPRKAKLPGFATVRVVVGEPLDDEAMQLLADRKVEEFGRAARERVVDCYEEAQRWRLER